MPFNHYSLTLSGVAQRLSSVLAVPTVGGEQDFACLQVLLAADPANAAAVYIGSSSSVSSTSHAFSLDPTQASQNPVSLGPFQMGCVKLSEIWVIGAANERIMIGLIAF